MIRNFQHLRSTVNRKVQPIINNPPHVQPKSVNYCSPTTLPRRRHSSPTPTENKPRTLPTPSARCRFKTAPRSACSHHHTHRSLIQYRKLPLPPICLNAKTAELDFAISIALGKGCDRGQKTMVCVWWVVNISTDSLCLSITHTHTQTLCLCFIRFSMCRVCCSPFIEAIIIHTYLPLEFFVVALYIGAGCQQHRNTVHGISL